MIETKNPSGKLLLRCRGQAGVSVVLYNLGNFVSFFSGILFPFHEFQLFKRRIFEQFCLPFTVVPLYLESTSRVL